MPTMDTSGYELFFNILERYIPSGFTTIRTSDQIIRDAELILEKRNQFFYIGDFLKLQLRFASKRCLDIFGIPAEQADPSLFISGTHPDDLRRHHMARAKLIYKAQECYTQKEGSWLISTTLRSMKPSGEYTDLLYQGYVFHSFVPSDTVYGLVVITDVSRFHKMLNKFHFYSGTDMSLFRFPDKNLLTIGNIFSAREYHVLQLIESGLNSEQIAQKIFRSVHTVDTHRRNIVKKAGKSSTSEVIIDLKNQGLL